MAAPEDLAKIFDALYSHHSLDGPEPWREANCVQWAQMALPLARTAFLGKEFAIKTYEPTRLARYRLNLPGGYHRYLTEQNAPDPIVIDGTYQQFASIRVPEAPRVLLAAASTTPAHLARAGIDNSYWGMWRADIYGDDVFTDINAPRTQSTDEIDWDLQNSIFDWDNT